MKQGDKLTSTEGFLCGLGAGVTEATLAGCFVQTVKTKFIHDQTQQVPKYKGFVHGVATIIKQEGVRGVYQVCCLLLFKFYFDFVKFDVLKSI